MFVSNLCDDWAEISVYQSLFFWPEPRTTPQIYVSLLYIWFYQHMGFHRRLSIIFEVVFLLGENSPRSCGCFNQSSNHLNAKLKTSHKRKCLSNLFTIKRYLTIQKGYEYPKKKNFCIKDFQVVLFRSCRSISIAQEYYCHENK